MELTELALANGGELQFFSNEGTMIKSINFRLIVASVDPKS